MILLCGAIWSGAIAACEERETGSADGGDQAMGLRFDRLPLPTADQLAPLESYRARDGAELPLRTYPADSDLALLLVHGSGSHSAYLGPLARRIADSGAASVYTPDLRGHGTSPRRRGDCDYIDQLQDDLADLLRQVQAERPGRRIAVGGHSSGGGLAVRFAGSEYREQAAAVLLLAPYLGYAAPTTRAGSGGWARPRVPVIVALDVLNRLGVRAFNGATAIRFAMPESVRNGSETLAYSYRLNTGYAPRDYRSDLSGLAVPLLALIGAEDEAFRPEQLAPALQAVLPARVEVLDGVGHLDLPSAPETAERVIAWLGSLVPPEPSPARR